MSFQSVQQWFANLHFSELGLTVIIVNLITLAGSGFWIRHVANNRSEETIKRRITALQKINVVILAIYLSAAIAGFSPGQKFAKQILCIMIAIGTNIYLQSWILTRFGSEREIDDKVILFRSYTSDMIGLLALLLVVSLTFIASLNIWELHSWLQASSIIGAFIVILYACKDYLLADIISSLVIHYNRTMEPGNVIRIEELGIYGIVQQITLVQTTIRDLAHRHLIFISNSRIRHSVIENLSRSSSHIKDFIDYKISYDHHPEQVESELKNAWQCVAEKSKILEDNVRIAVIENHDHAVIWRMSYWVNNPYKLLEIKAELNKSALMQCHLKNIQLNTPLTHEVKKVD